MKIKMILISLGFISIEIIRFQKCSVLLVLYAKMYEKKTNIQLYENHFNFETTFTFWFKILCGSLRADNRIVLKFKFASFKLTEK